MEIAEYWGWLSAGVMLIALEIVTPGVFFIWIGIGAVLTGIISAIFPTAGYILLGPVFGVLSLISVLIGRKLMGNSKNQIDTGLNNRGASYIGQIFQVYEPIINGRGKIKVDDTLWLASAKTDIPVNSTVKVTGVNGTFLEVEPTDAK